MSQGDDSAPLDDEPADDGQTGDQRPTETSDAGKDEGPGCFPAVLAATLLMGIVFFITCALLAWVIYGKRTDLAIRTLENTYIPQIEQSRMAPEDKAAIIEEVNELIRDFKAGEYENWQSGGVMTRLARVPIVRWGDLSAVESAATEMDAELGDQAGLQCSRLRRGIEMNKITVLDLEDVLKPVTRPTNDLGGRALVEKMQRSEVEDVIDRARFLADQAEVPNRRFPDVQIRKIFRRQIEAGLTSGTY